MPDKKLTLYSGTKVTEIDFAKDEPESHKKKVKQYCEEFIKNLSEDDNVVSVAFICCHDVEDSLDYSFQSYNFPPEKVVYSFEIIKHRLFEGEVYYSD
jgi:hypothetical protein